MVSFTVVEVYKLHVGDYVNSDKLQGGLMLSRACSKEPVICLEQFTTQWKVSAKGGNCQRYSPLPIAARLLEIFMSHLLNSPYAMTFAVFLK